MKEIEQLEELERKIEALALKVQDHLGYLGQDSSNTVSHRYLREFLAIAADAEEGRADRELQIDLDLDYEETLRRLPR